MSGSYSRMIILAAGMCFLAAGCQPVQHAPLELRAQVSPEAVPDLSAYDVETLPDLEQTNTPKIAVASTDTTDLVSSTPTSLTGDLAQVTTPPPQPDPASSPQPELSPQPAPPPQLEPATLVGSALDRLLLQLGEPDFQRKEGQVEIWQYRLMNCVVNFILRDEGDGQRVTAWVGRHRQLGLAYDHDDCIRDLGEREQL